MNKMTENLDDGVISRLGAHPRAQNTIGRLLLDAGKITTEDAEKIIKLQQKEGIRFGEAALKLGLVKQEDIQYALAQQFDYPYLLPGEGNFSPELVAAYYPYSEQVESLRALRTQLLIRLFHTGHKRLSLIGVGEGDGCSYYAANLAVVFSQLGEKTLLIDANMRRPRQHQIFNLGTRSGLSEILAGRADTSAICRIPAFIDLSVLTAGTIPPNPAELLARNTFPPLLEELGERFDVILLDTPPALHYADAQSLAVLAGATLLVARINHTRLAQIAKVKEILHIAGSEIVGAAINKY